MAAIPTTPNRGSRSHQARRKSLNNISIDPYWSTVDWQNSQSPERELGPRLLWWSQKPYQGQPPPRLPYRQNHCLQSLHHRLGSLLRQQCHQPPSWVHMFPIFLIPMKSKPRRLDLLLKDSMLSPLARKWVFFTTGELICLYLILQIAYLNVGMKLQTVLMVWAVPYKRNTTLLSRPLWSTHITTTVAGFMPCQFLVVPSGLWIQSILTHRPRRPYCPTAMTFGRSWKICLRSSVRWAVFYLALMLFDIDCVMWRVGHTNG